MAYSLFLGLGTSNWAEGRAMLAGLQHCTDRGIHKIIAEADSKLLVNATNEASQAPWRLVELVDRIKEIMEERGVIVQHCYREANKVADKLAFLSHIHKKNWIFTAYTGLPSSVRGLLQLDRLEMASFRVRQKKAAELHFEPP